MTLTAFIRRLESQLKESEKAIRHYDFQANAIRAKLAKVISVLGGSLAKTIRGQGKVSRRKKRRGMSRAGKARIQAALKKRWAAYRAGRGSKPGIKNPTGKKARTISKAHRRAIRAAKKAWWVNRKKGAISS